VRAHAGKGGEREGEKGISPKSGGREAVLFLRKVASVPRGRKTREKGAPAPPREGKGSQLRWEGGRGVTFLSLEKKKEV